MKQNKSNELLFLPYWSTQLARYILRCR